MRGAVFAGLLVAACAGGPEGPPATGRGVIAFDPAPPPDAAVYERPTWPDGMRLTVLQARILEVTLIVHRRDDGGYLLESADGTMRLWRNADLGDLGEEWPGQDARRTLRPADTRYHWPLWVGKHWRCHYAVNIPGQPPLAFEVDYRVEDTDRITVPAGTFDCLRIHRTQRVDLEGDYNARDSVWWYCPELGLEVRTLSDGSMTELVSFGGRHGE